MSLKEDFAVLICFDMRFESLTALYAAENDYNFFLALWDISRWKDMEQINYSGLRAALQYPSLCILDFIINPKKSRF